MDELTIKKIVSTRQSQAAKANEVSAESARDDSLYHKIVGDLNFDLFYFLRELQNRKINLTNDIRRKFLIRWHFADVNTRKPQNKEQVANALGISTFTVMEWIDSGWFNDEVERVKKKIDVMLTPHVQKVLVTKALNGDPKALTEFFDQSNKSSKDHSGLDLTNVPDEVVEEARIIAEADSRRKSLRLDSDEQDLSENISEGIQ